MDWFIIKNLGFDGFLILRFGTFAAAQAKYDQLLEEGKKWDEEHPEHPSDKGIAIIRGKVVVSDHLDNIV